VAWPPMLPLSLGKHGVGVGDATVAPHSLVVSRLPVQGNGNTRLQVWYKGTAGWGGLPS
jgi:hypothetical protein